MKLEDIEEDGTYYILWTVDEYDEIWVQDCRVIHGLIETGDRTSMFISDLDEYKDYEFLPMPTEIPKGKTLKDVIKSSIGNL